MACTFDFCSIFTDVRETIATLPKEPEELKTVLMAHLGISDVLTKPSNNNSDTVVEVGTGTGKCCGRNVNPVKLTPTQSEMSNIFKHPITYVDPLKIHELPASIIDDLEMLQTKPSKDVVVVSTTSNDDNHDDQPKVKGLYHYVFRPTSVYGNEYLAIWSKYYTTDIAYLKNTQMLMTIFDSEMLERAVAQYSPEQTCDEAFSTMKNTWSELRGNGKIADFKEKFSYVETPLLSKLNNSSSFLQFLSIYNISSPVVTLLTPIIVLIIPFFILMMRGLSVSVTDYIDILKTLISQHSIGKIMTQFDTVALEQKLYILMSVVFYFIQIYQNVMACIRFYNNIKLVHTHIHTIRGYLTSTGVNMSYMIQLIQTYHLSTYDGFKDELLQRYALLTDFTRALDDITPFSASVSKFFQIGYVMKNYYSLFSQTDLNELLDYSFGFNAYIEHLTACRKLVIAGTIHSCTFVESSPPSPSPPSPSPTTVVDGRVDHAETDDALSTIQEEPEPDATDAAGSTILPPPSSTPPPSPPPQKKQSKTPETGITKLNEQIYAPLNVSSTISAVPNDVSLRNQLIITGPNAAGKTTIIKTTLFNIILSQQIGYGFYKSADINPYEYLHCYLNIPDTSGRDSLFQAESRRCMEILTCVLKNPSKRHFCIFDELYSGTNPYEAVASAYGYIDFISKNPNVDLILTTHYIELCQLLSKHERIENLHMSTTKEGAYMYKIADGISTIKGGLKVLCDLEYPTEIIENARRIIERKD